MMEPEPEIWVPVPQPWLQPTKVCWFTGISQFDLRVKDDLWPNWGHLV